MLTIGALVGCRGRRPGAHCDEEGRFVCTGDNATALACNGGKWREVPCRGDGGCREVAKAPACDDETARAGDACMAENGHACTADGRAALVCDRGAWAPWRSCLGKGGCAIREGAVACDDTIAETGSPCAEPSGACSSDGATLLECKEGKLVPRASCRGPGKCSVDDAAHTLYCDHSIAEENDPCATNDELTCSADGKAQLACKGHTWTRDKECKQKCEVHPAEVPRCF